MFTCPCWSLPFNPPSVEEISCLSPLLSAVSLVPTMDIVYPWAPHGSPKPLSRIGVMKPLCEQTSMPHNCCEGNAKPWVGEKVAPCNILLHKGIFQPTQPPMFPPISHPLWAQPNSTGWRSSAKVQRHHAIMVRGNFFQSLRQLRGGPWCLAIPKVWCRY